jgi:D-tagatose-1,6-bisphosphate aldolase subunit GatZ/KbaZ
MMAGHKTQSASPTDKLQDILQENRRGRAVGVFCVCSAHPFVLQAAMQQAKQSCNLLIIESTSNQVNQFGGYTGQTPAQFAQFVEKLAASQNFPFEQVLLGGDHLGPHVWGNENSAQAMAKAHTLIHDSVLAGYTKIHLDASMHCADDPGDRHRPLADEIVSARAAELCATAEAAHRELPAGSAAPLYVIGTEVPIPGGELQSNCAPEITRTDQLNRTLQIAKQAFFSRGLQSAWERVIAVVAQPGVEFADVSVFAYNSLKAQPLAHFALQHWHGVYEAHSTDFQSASALREMVQDHFAILKVGPWLTFAFREAVFALAAAEEEWLAQRGVAVSQVREELDRAMLANPTHWKSYYHGDEAALRVARKYSYSDRARYYWPQPGVAAALEKLIANLTASPPPLSLLSQFLPNQAGLIREGSQSASAAELIRSKIREVLHIYSAACGNITEENS